MTAPNLGRRRRVTIEGEHWYLIVSRGPDGVCVDITCPRENAPEHAKLRAIMETVCANLNPLLTEVCDANA